VRIAQLAPLYEPVPPPGYGGTELAVHQITEELVRRGHDVTLFASGDSETSARLAAPVPFALWSERGRLRWPTPTAAREEEIRHVEGCFARAGEFDIVHNHAGMEGMTAAIESAAPVLTTHHLAYEPAQAPVFAAYPWAHHALSAAAARTFPARGQLPPIHHGIDVASYPFSERPEGYLLFLGRIVPDKGADHAIEIARRAGWELRIAGVTQEKSAEYGRRILAEADGRQIRYVGEAGPEEKRRLLGGADALLFPIRWDEPFGLVVIEAFACGTPVLAFAAGSAPELVEPGTTGFLAEPGGDPLAAGAGVDQLVEAIGRLGELSRRRCREEAERRFTVERMTNAYERTYDTVLSGADRAVPSRAAGADRTVLGDARAVVDDELPGEARTAKIRE
jgi:glycosyltransferase involved in cell wall biosynthesis